MTAGLETAVASRPETPNSVRPAMVVSGHTMALAVVRALGEAGIPVIVAHYDERDVAHASRFVRSELRVANPEHDEASFLQALLREGAGSPGMVLFPVSDESLVAISRHKEKLSQYFAVACSDWETTRNVIDKTRTYAIAEAHGVLAPITMVPESEAELPEAERRIGFPLLVKPAQSHLFYSRFKRKMVRVSSSEELRQTCRAAAEAGVEVMLQEIIPGDDTHVVNHNSYTVDGECVVEFTARHIRNAPPFFGSPRVARSEMIPQVLEPGRRIMRALRFTGFACTEFKFDARDGSCRLMEVNGRHNLSGLLAVRCGINFPLLHYRHLVEGELPQAADFVSGYYWVDAFRDVGYSLRYMAQERYRPGQYLSPYVRPHCGATLDRTDLGPLWARLKYLTANLPRTARAAGAGVSRVESTKEAD